MSRFPGATSMSFRVFDMVVPDGADIIEGSLQRVHDYMGSREGEGCSSGLLFRSRLPPSLTFGKEFLWGWAYLDEQNPVSVGPWLVFAMRSWKKRVPPRLFRSMVDERCAAWNREHNRERTPPAVKAEIKELAHQELLVATPPEVGDTPILLDLVRHRVIIPGLTDRQARSILLFLMPALRNIVHPDVRLYPWDLETYLLDSRPACSLPAEFGDRFLAFLTDQANRSTWAVVHGVPEHDEPIVFQLELDGKVKLATDDADLVSAAGGEACKDVLRWMDDDDRTTRVREVSLLITEPDPSNRQYAIRLDNEGMIRGCKMINGEPWKQGDALESGVFERAETLTEVSMYVRLLMHAFDAGPLEAMMSTARQGQLWPGHVEPIVEWHDDRPEPAALEQSTPNVGDALARTRRRGRARTGGIAELVENLRDAGVTSVEVTTEGRTVTARLGSRKGRAGVDANP